MKFVFKIIEKSTFEIKELCSDVDLVIASHSNIAAVEAEASGVTFISVTLQPDVIPKKLEKKSKIKVENGLENATELIKNIVHNSN